MSNAQLNVRPTEELEKLEQQPCCEKPEVDLAWNADMHHRLVETAKLGIEGLEDDPQVGTYAKAIAATWEARKDAILKAIDDADKYAPYIDYAYSSHFYDPDKGDTWGVSGKHALSQAVYYYNEAGWRIQNNASNYDIGYSIGLALHYVTDLTQPMHAANFIEIPILDMRHSGFERDANGWQFEEWSYNLSADDVSPSKWRSPAHIVAALARAAKDTYTQTMKPILDRKVDTSGELPNTDFSPFEVKTIMDRVSNYAPRLVATFLMHLYGVGLTGQIHAIYRRLLGRDAEPSGLASWGQYMVDGKSTRDIIRMIVGSAEFLGIIGDIAKRSVADATRELYQRILARGCGDNEIQIWAGEMQAGRYHDTALTMVDSPEYTNRFGPYNVPFPLV